MSMTRNFNNFAAQPVIPAVPIDGKFVEAGGQADNSLVTIYTIPSNYVLYLYNYYLTVDFIATGFGYLCIYDDSGAYKYRIDYMGGKIGDILHTSQVIQPPISLSEGETIRIFSSAGSVVTNAGFFGYRWYIS